MDESTPQRKKPGPKKGATYRKTEELRFDLIETLRSKNFDPVAALVEVHAEATKLYKKRLLHHNGFGAVGAMTVAKDSAVSIMEFVYPKRKAVELTGAQGTDLFQSFNDLVREIAKGDKE